MSFDERIHKLNEVQRGWINNYRIAYIQGKLNELDGWVRNRLRYCIWHHWKKPEKKRRSLIRLGVDPGRAYAWSRSLMGGWAIAQSPILGTTITLDRLKSWGFISLLDLYKLISPLLNEPLYTCLRVAAPAKAGETRTQLREQLRCACPVTKCIGKRCTGSGYPGVSHLLDYAFVLFSFSSATLVLGKLSG